MSILSQIGIIVLIIFIIFILIRSNRQLMEAAEEGEHFVDEWALREERKQEIIAAKEERKRELMTAEEERKRELMAAEEGKKQELLLAGEKKKQQNRKTEDNYEVDEIIERKNPEKDCDLPDNVVSIHREPEAELAFVELDENRRPIRRIPVRKLPFVIGRAADNDLVIDDLCVAKKHCRIIRKNHAFVMEDEGSRNKLAVGGAVLTETVLKDRLIIGIGNKEFLVELQEKTIS